MARSSSSSVLPVVLVVAVLALAGGAWFLLSEDVGGEGGVLVTDGRADDGRDGGALGESYDAAVEDRAPGSEVEHLAAPGAPSTRPDRDAAPRGPVARLGGRVVRDRDGTPLVGLAVAGSFDPQELDVEASTLVTDADGGFAFVLPVDGKAWWIEIEAGPDTPRYRRRGELPMRVGETKRVELRVPDGGLLSGTVVDDDGLPLRDVTVQGWSGSRWSLAAEPDRTVVTDGSGAWRLPALGPSFVLSAEHARLVPAHRLHGQLEHGEHKAGLELTLVPAVPLHGIVGDASGRPLEDATVRVQRALGESPTSVDGVYRAARPERILATDEQGRFSVDDTSAGRWQVEVSHADHAKWEGHHDPADGELVVVLTRGTTLTGTVYSTSGAPLADAEVVLDSAGWEVDNRGRMRTGDDGSFTFDNLQPDAQAVVSAVAAGHAVEVEQPVVLADASSHLDLVLAVERVLAGVVVDTAGAPVAGAAVEIEGDRLVEVGGTRLPKPTWERRHRLEATTTDAEGRFRLGGLYPGMFTVVATSPDDETLVARAEVASGTENLRLVLDPDAAVGVTFEGIARDALTLQPVAAFQVTPMVAQPNGGMGGYNHAFDDPSGRYRITGIESAMIQLMARADGYATFTTPAQHYDPGVHVVDVMFLPRRTAVFRVIDTAGRPVAHAQLGFAGGDGRTLNVEHGPSSWGSGLTADANGEARAAGLPAELLTVSVFRYDLRQTTEFPVDLRPEPLAPIVLTLPDPGEVQVPVHVLTAGLAAPSPEVGTGLATLDDDLAKGLVRPLGVPFEIVVVDAAGIEVSRGRAEPTDSAEPAVVHESAGVIGRWASVPWKRDMTLTVTAPGYAPGQLAGCIGCLDDSGVPALFVTLIPE